MRTRISLILLLLSAGVAWPGALVKYVDPDAGGTGSGDDWTNAYTSVATAEALNWNLTDAGGDTLTIWCRASSGTPDAADCQWYGWTTSDACYITVKDFDGTYVKTSTGSYAFGFTSTNTTDIYFEDLTIQPAGGDDGILVSFSAAGTNIYVDGCTFIGTAAGAQQRAIAAADPDTTIVITNSIFDGFANGADVDFAGIYATSASTIMVVANCIVTDCCYGIRAEANTEVYNCTVYGSVYGIDDAAGSVVTNCIVAANSNNDFTGSGTIDHCASDDGDGTNAIAPAGGNWANEFVDAGGGDFDLLGTGNCAEGGTTDPGGANQPDTDIEGVARTAPWSVGAYEEDAPAQAGGPQAELIVIDESE